LTTTLNASNSGSGGLVATADASGVLALQTAGTTALTINASQNVGIGTTSPASKLDINTGASTGTTDMITLGGLDNASTKQTYAVIQMGIENNTASSEQGNILLQTVESGTVRTRINLNGSGYQAFSNGGTEQMRITSAGVVQVGNNNGTGEVFAQNSLKFWVCMQASTGTAYSSFGLSSTSKITTGTFQLNYTRTMASSRYGCAGAAYGAGSTVAFGAESTTGIRMYVFTSSSGSLVDNDAMGNMGGGS